MVMMNVVAVVVVMVVVVVVAVVVVDVISMVCVIDLVAHNSSHVTNYTSNMTNVTHHYIFNYSPVSQMKIRDGIEQPGPAVAAGHALQKIGGGGSFQQAHVDERCRRWG